jgi:predicted kinase
MLVCLGGFPGSGSKALGQKISEIYGHVYFDMEQNKFRRYQMKNGLMKTETVQPRTDAAQVLIYDRVVMQFPLIAKMHDVVIARDVFTRAVPRGHFLKQAAQYFDPVVFVWVTCDEESAVSRFEKMYDMGVVKSVDDALRRRKRGMKIFQEFSAPPLVYHNASSDEVGAREVMTLVNEAVAKM